jgi:hypothetical protein
MSLKAGFFIPFTSMKVLFRRVARVLLAEAGGDLQVRKENATNQSFLQA